MNSLSCSSPSESSGRLGRRRFLENVGRASLAGLAVGNTISAAQPEKSYLPLDPKAPLRIGMIGRFGHLGYVLDEVDSVEGARIAAYAFEDADWIFNSDGSRRGTPYDLTLQQRWVENQPWAQTGPHLYETYQEMLEKEELDLAVVCLPYSRNASAIASAAEAGLHVLTEKPVATTIEDLGMAHKAVRENRVRLSAMFAMRYVPSIYTIWKSVRRGEIGTPLLARAQKSYKWGEERPWFYRSREIYGSTILWVGIHAVDYLRWTTGLEVERVSGFHSNLAHTEYRGVQDNAVVGLQFEKGATAAITMDFLRPDGAPSHGDDRLRIAGTRGILETMGPEGRVELLSKPSPPREIPKETPPASLFAEFVAELRGQGKHLIGPDEAFQVTRICILATQAADSGQVVTIKPAH